MRKNRQEKNPRTKLIPMFKKVWRIMTWDWSSLLIFEVIYKFLFLIFFGYGQDLIVYSLKKAGIDYVTTENVIEILKTPISLIGLIAFFILFVYFSFVEISAVILYCRNAAEGRKIKTRELFCQGSKRAFAIFKPRNLTAILLILFMVILTGTPFMSGDLGSIQIPGFILQFIYDNQLLGVLYFVAMAVIMLLLLQWVFSIHEFVLKQCSFKEARARSRELIKGRRTKTFLYILLSYFLAYVIAMIVKAAAVFVMLLIAKSQDGDPQHAFWFMYHNLEPVAMILFAVLQTVCLHCVIMSAYYHYQEISISREKRTWSWKRAGRIALQIIAVYISMTIYTEVINPLPAIEVLDKQPIEIVAHRAGSVFGPENTVAALKEAVKSGADSAEIDVQQTKDGELVVMHDTDFKRIAGVNKKVWEVTYEEASKYDVGGHLMQGFEGEPLPTLEQMIKAADGKIHLMIELKSSGHEEQLEEKTIALIQKYDFESQCSIASMNYSILKKVKALAPNIKTVYIAALAYGNVESLKAADAVSIEETFVTPQAITQAHANGKALYAWTVNDESQIKELMDMQVDGIVTDNAYYTSYILNTKGRSLWVMELVESVLK